MKNEIIVYRPDELSEHIEVRLDEDTVWLNPLLPRESLRVVIRHNSLIPSFNIIPTGLLLFIIYGFLPKCNS